VQILIARRALQSQSRAIAGHRHRHIDCHDRFAMMRLEQLRAEVLERVERVDRRANQIELRIVRIEQRVDDLAERLARLHLDVTARLDCIRDRLSAFETAQ
jgi:hypothetical protein